MSIHEDWGADAKPGEATTLRELIAGKPLEQRRALLIIRQVLEALVATHDTGATHGDVRPETIVITTALGKDTAKLGSAATPAAAKKGDPAYRAPESFAPGAVDARADIYAVGAVLYELLTGRPPFSAEDADGLRRLHAYAPLQPLKQRAPGVTFVDGLETTVTTALAKKRDGRFASAAAMIEAVDRALAAIGEPTPAPPTSERNEDANDSLRLLAQDLMAPSARAEPSVPLVPENVGRAVPELPLPSRASQSVRRSLDRLSTRLGIPRRRLIGALAAALAVGLVAMVVMCTGSSSEPKQSPPVVEQASAPPTADTLQRRCERLAKACGQGAKRVAKISAECTQAAATQIERGCGAAALAAYDCYEAKLCGKTDPVWALDDLRVLSARKAQCVAETNALRACTGR